ncbi:MAG TPA: neocarzinostatin apoprotein domain-containing protein, partial [Acidimicrobiia bacterium]
NEQVIVLECGALPASPDSCDLDTADFTGANAQGHLAGPYVVHRRLLTDSSVIDCLAMQCHVVALGETSESNGVAISFSKTGEPAAKVSATPAKGLRDLQRVELAGHGFGTTSQPTVAECLAAGPLAQSCVSVAPATGDGHGGFATSIVVRRTITKPNGTRVDCAKAAGTCEVLALDSLDIDYLATTPLSFDASVPPPPAPTLTVTPATKIPYWAHVRVRGAHWTPGDMLAISECAGQNCGALFTETQVAADGGFDTNLLVSRVVPDLGLETATGASATATAMPGTDCVKSHNCNLTVIDENEAGVVSTALAFDPKAPVPPAPSLTIKPGAPFKDGQVVQVAGAHFAPLARYDVSECAVWDQSESCFDGFAPGANPYTDATGAFTMTFTMVGKDTTPGFGFNCRAAGTTCFLIASSDGGVSVQKKLTFAAGSASTSSTDPSSAPAHHTSAPTTPGSGSTCATRVVATRGLLRMTSAGRRAIAACGDVHRLIAAARQ